MIILEHLLKLFLFPLSYFLVFQQSKEQTHFVSNEKTDKNIYNGTQASYLGEVIVNEIPMEDTFIILTALRHCMKITGKSKSLKVKPTQSSTLSKIYYNYALKCGVVAYINLHIFCWLEAKIHYLHSSYSIFYRLFSVILKKYSLIVGNLLTLDIC